MTVETSALTLIRTKMQPPRLPADLVRFATGLDLLVFVQQLTAFLADSNLRVILEYPFSDPRWFRAFIAYQHQIGNVNGGLLLYDSALSALTARAGMPLDHIDFFNDGPVFIRIHPEYRPDLSFFLACEDRNLILFLDLGGNFAHLFCSQGAAFGLDDFRGQRNDLHEVLGP